MNALKGIAVVLVIVVLFIVVIEQRSAIGTNRRQNTRFDSHARMMEVLFHNLHSIEKELATVNHTKGVHRVVVPTTTKDGEPIQIVVYTEPLDDGGIVVNAWHPNNPPGKCWGTVIYPEPVKATK